MICYGCGHKHRAKRPKIGATDCPRCDCLGFCRDERTAVIALAHALGEIGYVVTSRIGNPVAILSVVPERLTRRVKH